MAKKSIESIRGILSLVLYFLNTLLWAMPIFFLAILKMLVPAGLWRRVCDRLLNGAATRWVGCNTVIQQLLSPTRWEVSGVNSLDPMEWYLLLANHQSWVDILVLQRIFHRKIPFLKFFLKKELFWVPILGQAWWALDFPFMKRYSPGFLKKHPHLIGKDMEITRKACEKFKTIPITIMNFVEGTRFTPKKHAAQKSPYRHLLKTRAGGIGYVMNAMGGQIHQILDVTIVYPGGVKTFWEFVCGRVPEIRVHVESMPVTEELMGDYAADRAFRTRFQEWLNGLWARKDARIEKMQTGESPVLCAPAVAVKGGPEDAVNAFCMDACDSNEQDTLPA